MLTTLNPQIINTDKPFDLKTRLSTLWGAEQMPFGADAKSVYLTPATETLLQRLEQMTSVHASGMIYGPNGVGKSFLMDRFLDQLDDKRYLGVALSHSTLAGSGLLRMLSHLLGKPPRFRREDNIANLAAAFEELRPLWPVILLEEAQNLGANCHGRVSSVKPLQPSKDPSALQFYSGRRRVTLAKINAENKRTSSLPPRLQLHTASV